MDAKSCAEEHFRQGEAALRAGDHSRALDHFRATTRLQPNNPRYRSYLGLCMGLAERRFDKAVDLCRTAAKEEFFNPAMYHNLARVYLAFGFKAEAIRYLRRGSMIDPGNMVIAQELQVLGVRQKPPLRFLPRRHTLNRWLGALRGQLPPPSQEIRRVESEL
jgi:Flp pilus assembly protein TadD